MMLLRYSYMTGRRYLPFPGLMRVRYAPNKALQRSAGSAVLIIPLLPFPHPLNACVGRRVRNDHRAQLSVQANDLAVAINLQPQSVALATATPRSQLHKQRRVGGYLRRAAESVAAQLVIVGRANGRRSEQRRRP